MAAERAITTCRILIVDDHPVVRAGYRGLLEHEPGVRVCGEAEDVHEAMRLAEQLAPDIVIVDLSLRGGSGLDLLKRLRASLPGARAIVASMHEEADFADRALAAGAVGYVSKIEPGDTILHAVRRVMQGRVFVSPAVSERMLERLTVRGSVRSAEPVGALSDRELEVFEAIGRGRTTRSIAEELRLSIKTIETHRENIKRKLGLANHTELIRRAWQWVLEGPPPQS